MPDLIDHRRAIRITYDIDQPALLLLNGSALPVLDLSATGVRCELDMPPVRPATNSVFDGVLQLACGDCIPVTGRVSRTQGRVMAAEFESPPIPSRAIEREREFLNPARWGPARRSERQGRQSWRLPAGPTTYFEPRRSLA